MKQPAAAKITVTKGEGAPITLGSSVPISPSNRAMTEKGKVAFPTVVSQDLNGATQHGAEQFSTFTSQHGFEDVKDDATLENFRNAAWAAISKGGTVYLFGPSALFGREDRAGLDGPDDGLFIVHFAEGRLETSTDPAKPDHGARVQKVYKKVDEGQWKLDATGIPHVGSSLTITSKDENGVVYSHDTSELVAMQILPDPQDVRALFEAFGQTVSQSQEAADVSSEEVPTLRRGGTVEEPIELV